MEIGRWSTFNAAPSSSTSQWRFSLRFQQPNIETSFVAQRYSRLLRSVGICMPIAIFFYMVDMSITVADGGLLRGGHPSDEAHECTLGKLGVDGVMLVMLLSFWATTRCRMVVEKGEAAALEMVFSVVLCVVMTALALASPSVLCRIRGLDLQEVFGQSYYMSDSTLILKIDCIVTAAHLGPPLRWCFLFPLQVGAVFVCAANVFVIGSPEPMGQSTYNFCLLTVLVMLISVSKRVAEFAERRAFLDILKEKSLRFEAEFKLSQSSLELPISPRQTEPVTGQPSCASRSHKFDDSVPVTAISGAVFDPMFEKDVDPYTQLNRIAEMGDSEHWRVKDQELEILSDHVIGSGSFGVVVKAIFSGMVVAVKCPRTRLDPTSLEKLPELSNELRILRHLRHPNIVTIHGAIIEPHEEKIALVLEYVHGVTLDKFIGPGDGTAPAGELPSPFQRYQVMIGVSMALVYMHSRMPHIVHGDLKSANIMVETRSGVIHPKLLDFGLSRIVTRSPRPLGGTLIWVAPEVLRQKGFVKCSADIYSFGRLLGYLATGIRPLMGMQPKQIRFALKQDMPPLPTWPRGCIFKESLRPLVNACLRIDHSRRPNTSHVHEKLLHLPQELGFEDQPSDFMENIRIVGERTSQHMCSTESQRPAETIALSLQLEQVLLSQRTTTTQLSGPTVQKLSSVPETTSGEDVDEQELLYPDKMPTEPKAMVVSLVELITSWNFPVGESPCCVLHAGVRVCQQLCCQMLDKPCFGQDLDTGGQCLNCGMLGLDKNVEDCPVCRSQVVPRVETGPRSRSKEVGLWGKPVYQSL